MAIDTVYLELWRLDEDADLEDACSVTDDSNAPTRCDRCAVERQGPAHRAERS